MTRTSTSQKKDNDPRSLVENLESSCRIMVSTKEGPLPVMIIANINKEIDESITTRVDKEGCIGTGCHNVERSQEST